MNKVRTCKVSDVSLGVYDGPHATPPPCDNGAIFLGIRNITENGQLKLDNPRYISEEDLPKWTKRVTPHGGDIVFSYEATLNLYAIIPEGFRGCLGRRMGLIRPNPEEINGRFLYYYFFSPQWRKLIAQKTVVGSTVNRIPIETFPDFKLLLPSKPTQSRIAAVLSALDEKIAHNNELIKMLEEQAQLVYDYWFMQFDFPDENGRPYRSSGGKMVWNAELGREIPDGWVVATLEELLSTTATGDWGKDQPISSYQQKVYCIRGADIEDVDELPVRYILKKNSHKFLDANDIVIEISGGSPTQSTGRSTFISAGTLKRYDYPVICTNFCQSLRLKDVRYAHYFHRLWNKLYDANIMFNYEGKTSGIKNLLLGQFCKIKWSVPPKEIAGQYQDFTEGLTERREQLKEEQKALRIQRDFLLPLLMSGQVKVAE